jgi:hypothetical protein
MSREMLVPGSVVWLASPSAGCGAVTVRVRRDGIPRSHVVVLWWVWFGIVPRRAPAGRFVCCFGKAGGTPMD